MTRVHFLTFGDGSPQFRHAATRLSLQAKRTKSFASVSRYSFDSISRDYPEFWHAHGRFILGHPRGAGYWLWKPFLIFSKLREIGEGEFLIYADAGCEIPLREGIDWGDVLPTEPNCDLAITRLEVFRTVGRWTSKPCLDRFDLERRYESRPQYQATLLFLKNGPRTRELIFSWLEGCFTDNYSCLVDVHNQQESDDFRGHRHDQSILTLKLYEMIEGGRIGVKPINLDEVENDDFPIRIYRNATPFTLAKGNTLIRRGKLKIYSLILDGTLVIRTFLRSSKRSLPGAKSGAGQ